MQEFPWWPTLSLLPLCDDLSAGKISVCLVFFVEIGILNFMITDYGEQETALHWRVQ